MEMIIVDLFCLAGSKLFQVQVEVFLQQPSYYLVKKLILLIIWMKNIFYFIKILNHILYNIRNIFKNN